MQRKSQSGEPNGAGLSNTLTGISNAFGVVKDAINSVISSVSKYVDEYTQMQEHTASVTKYTGLAKEEVGKLNESFQRMDTATPRAKLNDLAADAGRLGIQSRQSVQEFVEAADQINTALGDDLGEDAVKNIGKLAQINQFIPNNTFRLIQCAQNYGKKSTRTNKQNR